MRKLLVFFVLFCLCSINLNSQLKITCPNGGEKFVVGSDTLITWEGLPATDTVSLEYSTNNGDKWKLISDKATGLKHIWNNIPKPSNNKCLVRITKYLIPDYSYPSVKIGNQIWMSRNLDVGIYRNGDSIPELFDSSSAVNVKTGAWSYYNNDPALGKIYGKLYNWNSLGDPRGLAPKGWHVATEKDFWELRSTLIKMFRSDSLSGKLKSTGTIENGDGLWKSPNIGASNETGFAGLPGGFGSSDNNFEDLGIEGRFWLYSEDEVYLTHLILRNDEPYLLNSNYKEILSSVRCICDTVYPTFQSDTSNTFFSIVSPQASAKDIDMKNCYFGGAKDTLINDFIVNRGFYKFRIDSIYFSGADRKAFNLVTDLPKYILNIGDSKSSEFSFTPMRIGKHSATINIITQSDILISQIIGEGIEQTSINDDGLLTNPRFIEIIPNPAGDYITITLKPSEGFEHYEGSAIQIYNTLGEKVMSFSARHAVPLQINISALPKGMYFVKAGGEVAKFVKM
ncbi:MAG: FISUMP domain-containing protein [bacterium]